MAPDMLIIDSLADFLSMCGLDENASMDFTKFFGSMIKPLRDRSIAIIILDHEPWESRGHARGSTAKLAKVDVEWELRQTRFFDRDQQGELMLTRKKDRLAQLREKTITYAVGGPSLRFEITAGMTDSMGGTSLLMTDAMRHTLDAIKSFGEQGATASEWRDATGERGTKESRFYDCRRELVNGASPQVVQRDRRYYYDSPSGRPTQKSYDSTIVVDTTPETKTRVDAGETSTTITPIVVELESVINNYDYSGGSSTPEYRSNDHTVDSKPKGPYGTVPAATPMTPEQIAERDLRLWLQVNEFPNEPQFYSTYISAFKSSLGHDVSEEMFERVMGEFS
jgi:hypothetical protein